VVLFTHPKNQHCTWSVSSNAIAFASGVARSSISQRQLLVCAPLNAKIIINRFGGSWWQNCHFMLPVIGSRRAS